MSRGLYVETTVRAPLDRLWALTQDPVQHQRWDLRFSEIEYDEPPAAGQPQRFRYAVRLGPRARPLARVAGVGTTLGERVRPDGTRTSALGFRSADPRSPILEGSGWWRYVPTPDGVRFLTGYDYVTRWGGLGTLVDRVAFRPWMGWATAWSFDRLRIWLETGLTPDAAARRGALDAALRTALVVAPVLGLRGRHRGLGERAAWGAAVVVGVVAAARLPPPPGAPRAARCRRHPSDQLGRRAPAVASRLVPVEEP